MYIHCTTSSTPHTLVGDWLRDLSKSLKMYYLFLTWPKPAY